MADMMNVPSSGNNEELADVVMRKTMVKELYAAARLLVSKGFHVFKDPFLPNNRLFVKEPYITPRDPEEMPDPFVYDSPRILMMRRLAEEIIGRNLPGVIAELGVWKRERARIIRRLLPGRLFYLFDTFEGFTPEQMRQEMNRFGDVENKEFLNSLFRQTSTDLVLGNIGNAETVIVKKGVFPESAKDVDDRFVFVHIDVDLYQPTLDGLEFFYPRMTPGGYIMIHDYGHPTRWRGCKEAVREFCDRNGAAIVPLIDYENSAVIGIPYVAGGEKTAR